MKKIAFIIAMTLATSAMAQEQKTTLEFTAQQLQLLGSAIQELPKKIADPFLEDLQRQIAAAQQKKANEIAKAKTDADAAAAKEKADADAAKAKAEADAKKETTEKKE